jgi:ABC-type phosphate transport system substrate-binding protein
MKNYILKIVSVLALFTILISCDNNSKKNEGQYEAWNSGELSIYYDKDLNNLLDSVFKMYVKAFPDIKATFIPVSAREGMALLLNGKAKVVVQSRKFLNDEDSLMKVYNVSLPEPWEFAKDALVLFTSSDIKIDTMNAKNIEEYFENYNLTPQSSLNLSYNPEFVIPEVNSGIYSNFRSMILKNKRTQRTLKTFSNIDSVKTYVAKHPNSIGIGYLSNILGDVRFKPIPLGFYDSTGKYVNPKPVHQAYIVQDLYPYIITYRAYLLTSEKNLALWFATFISRESYIQKYFKDYGIVPTYAKIVLLKGD